MTLLHGANQPPHVPRAPNHEIGVREVERTHEVLSHGRPLSAAGEPRAPRSRPSSHVSFRTASNPVDTSRDLLGMSDEPRAPRRILVGTQTATWYYFNNDFSRMDSYGVDGLGSRLEDDDAGSGAVVGGHELDGVFQRTYANGHGF